MTYRISLIQVTITKSIDDLDDLVFDSYTSARTALLAKLTRRQDAAVMRIARAHRLPQKYNIRAPKQGASA